MAWRLRIAAASPAFLSVAPNTPPAEVIRMIAPPPSRGGGLRRGDRRNVTLRVGVGLTNFRSAGIEHPEDAAAKVGQVVRLAARDEVAVGDNRRVFPNRARVH